MTPLSGKLSALRTTKPLKDMWWVTLIFPYLVGAIQLLAIVVLEPSDYPSLSVYIAVARLLAVFFAVTLVLSILGLYFDILYVAETADWKPTMWYSLMFFTPIVGPAIGLHYLFKRSVHVGLFPSTHPRFRG